MKPISWAGYLAFILVLSACKKDGDTSLATDIKKSFLDSSIDFLKTKMSPDDFQKVDLPSSLLLTYRGTEIGVRVQLKVNSTDSFIIIYKNAGNFFGNRIIITGLRSKLSKQHDGTLTLRSLDNTSA